MHYERLARRLLASFLALTLSVGQVSVFGAVAYAGEVASGDFTHTEEVLVAQADQFKIGANKSDVSINVNLPILKGKSLGFGEETFGVDNATSSEGVRYVSIGVDNKNTSLMKDLLSGKTTLWENAQKSVTVHSAAKTGVRPDGPSGRG